jgi:hypothetical protein
MSVLGHAGVGPRVATCRVLVGILFTRFEPRRLKQPAGTGGELGAAPVLRLSAPATWWNWWRSSPTGAPPAGSVRW